MGYPQPMAEHHRYTVEDYLAMDRTSDDQYEYLDGLIYAMAGESGNHADICTNLTISIGGQLRGTDCRARVKDTKVLSRESTEAETSMKGLFSYPDLVVVCGEPQYLDARQDVLLNPKVIIEVLSDSTEAYDRGEKFLRYRTSLPSLVDYLLVSQSRPVVEHHHREGENRWVLITHLGLESTLQLDSIHCTLRLADIYDRIEFSSDPIRS